MPDTTFTDKMTLGKGQDRIDLYYFGPGDTNGDAFVVFAALRAMCIGDLMAWMKGECGDASTRTAAAMFLQAVRLTVTLGPGFGVPQGAVSLPVDVVIIPREGAITAW